MGSLAWPERDPSTKVLAVHPQAQIRKVLDIVQALPMGDIFASTAQADAYIDALQREVAAWGRRGLSFSFSLREKGPEGRMREGATSRCRK